MNDLIRLATAALKYDSAIQACANDPDKMASHCTAEGDDLDTLYADWVSLARAAMADDEEHPREPGEAAYPGHATSGREGATPKDSADPQEAARDHFNAWYVRQPMPQLLARVDPQQAAFNAFEEGVAYGTTSGTIGQP